ncbi:MAG: hypothetical protein ABUU24_04130 [Variovorax sp.]
MLAVTALATLALSACATQSGGTGSGNVRGTRKPVAFTWQSTDRVSGDITATFGNGDTYKGSFFQITRDTRVDRLDPLWSGWGQPYPRTGWRYWDRDMDRQFIREYNGRVLANLQSDTGNHMRCRFTLVSPSRGMAGGGKGRCQLSETGREINAEFPRQS